MRPGLASRKADRPVVADDDGREAVTDRGPNVNATRQAPFSCTAHDRRSRCITG
jgi:hypothetical protein